MIGEVNSMTAKIDENGNGPAPSEQDEYFEYRGLKFHLVVKPEIEGSYFWYVTIKQGNRIVIRSRHYVTEIEDATIYQVGQVYNGVDRGYGLNIDYDKVQGED